ncbi:thrombospondin type 3 repeat-containing protein [Flavilitoribacter nigricans]|uniref:Secretion system C-terminal sorting domain-containing protein n=1 Tax=Flavilitoribacter nigricans (strain ATCC 23147 / DSM 23189 / NBRC 102662 / NCIMB 1420 / SS-2) TaxID=1122177 RepID=A0A2D0NHM3_FLAN2|nr:hypothetical protein CRP01_04400 [Flavilitoribacter nigricans DSM 23189 = NBRC 102662]
MRKDTFLKGGLTILVIFFALNTTWAQSMTVTQINKGNDYYFEVELKIRPDQKGCDCNATQRVYVASASDDSKQYAEKTRAASTSNWTVRLKFPRTGKDTEDIRVVFAETGFNKHPAFPDFPCQLSCLSIADEYLTVKTQRLRAPKVEWWDNGSGGIGMTWTNESDVPANLIDWVLYKNNNGPKSLGSQTSYSDTPAKGQTHEYRVSIHVPKFANPNETWSETIMFRPPDGIIRGKVATKPGVSGLGTPVQGVEVCAVQTNNIPGRWAPGAQYCTTTDAEGNYTISDIYYGADEGTFRIEARKAGHGFDPAFRTRTLSPQISTENNVNFIDTTSFLVKGQVVQQTGSFTCGLPEVEMLLDGQDLGFRTDNNGNFSILVEQAGTYKIRPRYKDHTFQQTEATVVVTQPINGLSFTSQAVDTISGYVHASCERYIGQAEVRIFSTGSCLDTTIMTDPETGYYQMVLPAREYTVTVKNFSATEASDLNDAEVVGFFQDKNISLLEGDQQVNFTYRRPPIIQLTGLEGAPCTGLDHPVLEQHQVYPLIIEVWEEVGVCPVDTGLLTIVDRICEAEQIITLPISQGRVAYELKAGTPNIIQPYLKNFSVSADVDGRIANLQRDLIVTGVRAREKTFATVSPELPLLILRDPPGDASSSYLQKNTTLETALRFSALTDKVNNPWVEAKLGTTIEVGVGITTEYAFWGMIGASTEIGASTVNNEEYIVSYSVGENFSTSDNEAVTGQQGDVFMGAALNLIYALADEVIYDPDNCRILTDVSLILGNDGFATTYTYTESHIRNSLLPDLSRLRDLNATNNPDTAAYFADQIAVWEQALQRNEELKEKAKFKENRSFSANAPYESTVSSSSTESISIEFNQLISQEVAVELGFEVAGSGVSGGNRYTFRMETGESETQTTTKETTTGFILNDDDEGDFYSVDIKTDPVYNTPVFELVSGRSSCPLEPGTQPRDDLQISAEELVKTDVDPNKSAVFKLLLGNISQSEEARTYLLQFNQASNPDAARIRVGGSEVQGPISYTINPFQQVEVTVEVERGPLAYSYDGLEFTLSSDCDPDVSQSVTISAFFTSDCSPIRINDTDAAWLVNSTDDQTLDVQLTDYDKTKLQRVEIEIAAAGTNNWETLQSVEADQLADDMNAMAVPVDLGHLHEGNYQVRARLLCDQGFVYSEKWNGLVDRSPPMVFGQPEPVDDEYLPGDLISVSFNEPLNCLNLTKDNITVKRLSDDVILDAQFGCSGNQLIILPEGNFAAQVGENYEIRVAKVADQYGNAIEEPVVWKFAIGAGAGNPNPDMDGDGIPDTADNCLLAANALQSDIDGDGIGDSCDEDVDGDGIVNALDNAPIFSNPDQLDSDNNGIGDVAEPDADGDQDGIVNSMDNCINQKNGDQADLDQDGIGDACDEDIDGDGIPNYKDNCQTTPNALQEDEDQDGIGDACKNTVGTQELDYLNDLQIYPNPGDESVFVRMGSDRSRKISLELYDVFGRQRQQQTISVFAGQSSTYSLATWQLPAGMYYLVLKDEQRVRAQQLVIAH